MGEPEQKESQTAPAEASLFTESGVRFFAAYRFWIVATVWLGARGYAIWGLLPNYYVNGYLKIAGDWLSGFTPYAAFKVEYPPGALLLFLLPRIFTQAPVVYGYVLAFLMLLADLGVLLLLWRLPALVFVHRKQQHRSQPKKTLGPIGTAGQYDHWDTLSPCVFLLTNRLINGIWLTAGNAVGAKNTIHWALQCPNGRGGILHVYRLVTDVQQQVLQPPRLRLRA